MRLRPRCVGGSGFTRLLQWRTCRAFASGKRSSTAVSRPIAPHFVLLLPAAAIDTDTSTPFPQPVLHMNGKYIGRHRLNATTFKKQLEAYRAGDELFHIAHLTPSRETIRRRGGDPLKFQVEREEHLKRVEANQAKRLAHLDGQEAVETEVDELGEPWAGEEDAEGVKKASSTVRPKPKLSRRARKRPTESWTPPTNVDGTPIRRSKEESKR